MEKHYWRSENELKKTKKFKASLHREFPEGATELKGVSRRNFLKLMGASAAFAGLAGCDSIRRPVAKIYPYARRPENLIPGKPNFYATTMALGEEVTGLLVESHEGRPTKIEGNPAHSQSLGATTSIHQASILDLYDPDRLTGVIKDQQRSNGDEFQTYLESIRDKAKENNGKGLTILTETQTSPTFFRLLSAFQKKYSEAKIFKFEPISRDNMHEGNFFVTGKWVVPTYDFSKADIVVSLDSNFLGSDVGAVANAKGFSKRREPDGHLNRLYAFENRFTIVGSVADHRYKLKPSEIERVVWMLADQILPQSNFGIDLKTLLHQGSSTSHLSIDNGIIAKIAEDLIRSSGKSIIIAGPHLPKEVHGLVYLMNLALNNLGSTVIVRPMNYAEFDYQTQSHLESAKHLNENLNNEQTETLIILGGNPAYNGPADLELNKKIEKVNSVVHLTQAENETSLISNWIVPRAHYLESWGDAVAVDGTKSMIQPLISPMYNGKTDIEILATLVDEPGNGYEIVRRTWQGAADNHFELQWRKWLHEGIVSGPRLEKNRFDYINHGIVSALTQRVTRKQHEADEFEVTFYPDEKLYDGRFANNGWLQELPEPITKLTWDNAALISPKTARKLSVDTEKKIKIKLNNQWLDIVVFVEPGHADNSISLALGNGRTTAGRIGELKGFNVYPHRTSSDYYRVEGVQLTQSFQTYILAGTQDHASFSMGGRELFREGDIEEYKKNPGFANEIETTGHPPKSSWPEVKYDKGYQWGMAIDLNKCTGCNACITACQAENNIPIVGKDQVHKGREMHWIRVDRYFEGDEDNPNLVHQPMTCLQCELAPCEEVCPVAATTHSTEGLNDMAYNRCVGTRYCSNNCPVKVRRFNFFDFHQRNPQSKEKKLTHVFDYWREPAETVKMQFNPDVTVRMRGVMEKCTYCIQRINEGKIRAANENRNVFDGEIVTACQQACPSEAISFGNIRDPKSKVAKLKARKRNYEILAEIHLKARTTYLASIKNLNPELMAESSVKQSNHKGHHK